MSDNPFNTRPKLTALDLRQRFPELMQIPVARVREIQCKAVALDFRDGFCYHHTNAFGTIFYKYRI